MLLLKVQIILIVGGIYSENKVNSIGNLILIPKLQNINLSNHNWSVKKPFLKAMSTSNIDERKKLFKEASDAGLNLSAQRINYLVNYETSSELLKVCLIQMNGMLIL